MNKQERLELQERLKGSFIDFCHFISPEAVWGSCHYEVMRWLENPDTSSHKLLLFPRDHGKSRIAAHKICWDLVRDPTTRVIIVSATSNLAEKQLKFIKDKLESPRFLRIFPEYLNMDKGKRSKWTDVEINLDHPARLSEGVRDASVFAAGLTTNITGLHCDMLVLDDVVVNQNAYTEVEREKLKTQYSFFNSIVGTDAEQLVVGTRYHPDDLYGMLKTMNYDIVTEEGEFESSELVFDCMQREVETDNEFLWPRQQRQSDGKWFGFNQQILAKKKAGYLDKTQYYAQYYNNPNDPNAETIDRSKFQYYDRNTLVSRGGSIYFETKEGIRTYLRCYAGFDLAFSDKRKADYSVIAVVGMDDEKNVYIIDIDRYKTEQIHKHAERIQKMYDKYPFVKMRAETVAGQKTIIRAIKDNYLTPDNYRFPIEEYVPTRHDGDKETRINSTLYPLYELRQLYHYAGGECQTLEDELMTALSAHDDVKDAVHMAVKIAKPYQPVAPVLQNQNHTLVRRGHSRFGGAALR